jgi:hypothetical protein
MSSGLVTTWRQAIVACLISSQLLRRETEKLHEICHLTANVSANCGSGYFTNTEIFLGK